VNEARAGNYVGRWKLDRTLGQGEFGATYRARAGNGARAAIKLLATPPGDELRALTRVVHPCVIGVLGGGGDPPHLVMEYAPGRPLTTWLRKRPAPEKTAVRVAAYLADALAAIHQAGVVHGDIKPDNVIVQDMRGPRLKIVDFGMAGERSGGTLDYAAPEKLRGSPGTPASDVYSLGLILWQMLHGELPWAGMGFSAPLMKRQRQAPEPSVGEEWLRTLLSEALDPDPAHRPSASALADRLAQHGVNLPEPGLDMLQRRVRSLWILSRALEDTLGRWLSSGGSLALCGPAGAGRSHVLAHLANELQARGRPWLGLDSRAPSWVAVEAALRSPSLPGRSEEPPEHEDPGTRAERAARLVFGRCPVGFHVLADDLDEADEPARLFVEALSRQPGVHVCSTSADAPSWTETLVDLPVLDDHALAELVEGALGDVSEVERIVQRLRDAGGGLPGPSVAFLLHAVDQGAIRWHARRWHLDPVRLGELSAADIPEFHVEAAVGEDARRIGYLLAAHMGSVPRETLFSLTGLGERQGREGLLELEAAGLARMVAGRAHCTSEAAARTLHALDPSPERTHRLLAEQLLGIPGSPAIQLGWHIVHSRDKRLCSREGPAALTTACSLDGGAAGRLADALWDLAPSEELATPRMRALVAAGRVDDASRFAERVLADHPEGSHVVPLLGMLAHVEANIHQDDARAMALLEKAREALGGAPLTEELLEIKARAHFRAGRSYEAIDAARRIADSAPPSEPERLDRWLAMRVIWAQALQQVDRLQDAVSLLQGIPSDVGEGRASRALHDATLGRLLWHAGQVREAGDVMAAAAGEEQGLPAADRARILSNAGLARYGIGDRAGALQLWEQAALLMERLGDEAHLVIVRTNLCVGYREAGMWERAREAGEWAHRRAGALDIHESEAMAAGNLGDLALAEGALDEAERWFGVAAEVADANDLQSEKVELARRVAELAAERNDPSAADKANHALAFATEAEVPVEAARASALLALAHAREGHLDRMRACLDAAIDPLIEAGDAGGLAEVRLAAARALNIAGQQVDALQQATRALVYADEVQHAQLRKRADQLVASIRRLQATDVGARQRDRLLALAVAVARERNIERLLDAVASSTLDLLGGDRSFVLETRNGDPVVVATAVKPGVEPGQPSMTVVQRALADGREVIAADVGERGDLRGAKSVVAMNLGSAMCVPMLDGEERVGALYVDSGGASDEEVTRSVMLLRALGSYAAVAIHNARQLRDAAQRAEQAAEVAHDLRSPAAGIQLAAMELLEDHPEGDPKRDRVLRILDGAQRVQAMAGEFLQERSRSRRKLDLSEHFERAAGLVAYEAAALELELLVDIQPGLQVLGDHNALSRVLTNLVGNAIRNAPERSQVTIAVVQEGGEVVLRVRDRGPGIPEDGASRIFERGEQVAENGDGHGLGLAIVRRLVTDHGGTVDAANHPDGGALFTVRLPLAS